MKFFSVLATASAVAAAPLEARGETPREMFQRAEAVKQAFQIAWDGYYKYCFNSDELQPVNNTCDDSRNGWGASAVDALSTALVQGNRQVVNEILDLVPKINWSNSYQDESVSLFETTIRYLGGLLSGYDLLSGPLHFLANDKSKIPILLQQAAHLANNLSYAFDTPTGIPYNNLYFNNRSNDGSTSNGLATIGTLILEWQHLSDLTGNKTYGALAQKAQSYLLNPQPPSSEPWPGLLGSDVSIQNGSFLDDDGSWEGGDDSFYEYLIKIFVYDSTRFTKNRDRWIAAADSTIAHLASHPEPRPDLTYLAAFDGETLILSSDHLACFDGGSFILGGLVLKQEKYIQFGLQLVDGCENLYNQTLTGIGPDAFAWDPAQVPADQKAFYEKAGFYITSGAYYLRPEVLESFYYAYRATGKRQYQDYSWNAFKAINATTHVGSGYSEITNVNVANGGGFYNTQDSYFFAEVLQYAYSIHGPDTVWQVNHKGKNQYVLNTEGHFLKVAGPPV